MPFMLQGAFGNFALLGGGNERVFEMPVETTTQFFRKLTLKKLDLAMNELGLYSFLPVGRDGKAKMANLSVPKNLFQPRTNCMTWSPKGKMYFGYDEVDVTPIEAMMEHCPDALYGQCWERILGTGNQIRDILATAEGRRLFALMLENIFLGMGNSIYDIVDYGQHPLIYQSATNDWWNKQNQDLEEWNEFINQQTAIGIKGHTTLMDEYASKGAEHFNIQIYDNEVSEDGQKFIGTAEDLFKRVVEGARPNFKRIIRRRRPDLNTIIKVTPSIYDKYEEELIAKWVNIPEVFQYSINRGNGNIEPLDGVLKWKGNWIVSDDSTEEMDSQLGVKTHRITATVEKNFVVAHDVQNVDQYNGVGLRINQLLPAPWKGKTFMDTNLKLGTAIADTDFVSTGKFVTTPA